MGENNKNISGRVTSKGQVTIPAELRKEWNIEEGDRLEFVRETAGSYKVQPIKKKSLRNVIGILKTDKHVPIEEAREIAYKKMGRENLELDLDEENRH